VGGETAAGLALWEPLPGDVIGTYAHVLSGAFSPDGTRFALVGRDVRLFDAATGRQLRTVSPHAGSILAPVFSPDGSLLAVPGTAGTGLLDLRTGRNLKLTANPAPETPSTYTTAVGDFSPDSRLYAAWSPTGAVTVWSTSTGQVVAHLRRHAGAVTTVQFSPDGRLIASAGLDHMTYLEPADGHGPVRTLRSPGAVAGLGFSPDGRRLATVTTYAGGNGELQLWDARTGRQIGRPVGNAGSYLRFLPGGHELITGSSTAGIDVVEVKDAGLRDQGSIGTSDALDAVLLGANEAGGLVLTMELGAERIYSLAGVQQIGTLGVRDHFQTVVSSPSGTRVLTIDLPHADDGGGTEVARLYACDACGSLPEARRYAQALLREAAIP
jgi:WD40 repeat protein